MAGFVRSRAWLGLSALTALVLPWGSAFAHHSLAGEFDTRKSVALTGIVSRVEWANPHIYLYLDVPGTGGKVVTWQLECVPVAMAHKAGVSKKMLEAPGERVSVSAYPARDGTPHLGFLAKMTFADGHNVQFAADTQ